MLRERLFLLIVAFHFTLIILYNIVSMATGYASVYGEHGQEDELNKTVTFISRCIQLPVIYQYAHYSGAETCFGFFAPQVGNQYISVFRLYDDGDVLLGEYQNPGLHQQESLQRYAAFLDLFQDMLFSPAARDSLNLRYARAVVYSMGERLGKARGAMRVDCQILLYRHPLLYPDEQNKAVRLIPIYEVKLDLVHRL